MKSETDRQTGKSKIYSDVAPEIFTTGTNNLWYMYLYSLLVVTYILKLGLSFYIIGPRSLKKRSVNHKNQEHHPYCYHNPSIAGVPVIRDNSLLLHFGGYLHFDVSSTKQREGEGRTAVTMTESGECLGIVQSADTLYLCPQHQAPALQTPMLTPSLNF